MKWKRKFIALPHKTISGEWFMWKHVWCRPINNLSKKLEYELNPNGLETEFGRTTWEGWLVGNGWSPDQTKEARSAAHKTIKEAMWLPKTFNDALRLSLDSPTKHIKFQAKSKKPTSNPPSPTPSKHTSVGDVRYNDNLDVMERYNGKEYVLMTAYEVRIELLKTQMEKHNRTSPIDGSKKW